MKYQEFNSTKSSKLNKVKDPIVIMRLISDVEGWFYTCSYPENQKVKFTLNPF